MLPHASQANAPDNSVEEGKGTYAGGPSVVLTLRVRTLCGIPNRSIRSAGLAKCPHAEREDYTG
jgi:hypothetical protein